MADFSQNIVNQRFKQVYDYLENNNLIKGKSDIAKKLGTYNHVINSILKAKRNITVDQLNKLFEIYSVNANFLFGISDEMIAGYGDLMSQPFSSRTSGGRANIQLVTHKALAGNLMASQEYEDEVLSSFSVPGLEGSNLFAIEIEGNSMFPTITNGDVVVCEQLERGESLKANSVYVIVTKDGVVAKRIQQNKENNSIASLSLISDNSNTYKPYDVDIDEVVKILKVKCRLTNFGMN
jgi:phage repressor protein C with HTH and peptisase S24 domain